MRRNLNRDGEGDLGILSNRERRQKKGEDKRVKKGLDGVGREKRRAKLGLARKREKREENEKEVKR